MVPSQVVATVGVSRVGSGASPLTGRSSVQIQPARYIQAAPLKMFNEWIETAVLRDDAEDPARIVSRMLAEVEGQMEVERVVAHLGDLDSLSNMLEIMIRGYPCLDYRRAPKASEVFKGTVDLGTHSDSGCVDR